MNTPPPPSKQVFTTPWFQIWETPVPDQGVPYYSISANDSTLVIALTPKNQLVLAHQFRHAIGTTTLELPGGQVDPGETAEQAARRELLEETGYEADTFALVGTLSNSTARYTSRMWCFVAQDARLSSNCQQRCEAESNLVLYDRGLQALSQEPEFLSVHSCAALFLALLRGKLSPAFGLTVNSGSGYL